MNPSHIIRQLKQNENVFRALLSGLSKEEYLWRPHPEHWCALEIICHLHDEECEDFRARTQQVLENPELLLPPAEPLRWIAERKYMEQDFEKKLEAFLAERKASIQWLQSLVEPKWDNAFHHPSRGKLSAQFFLTNWLAHDYLHIRQLNRVMRSYLEQTSNESLEYAGNW